MRIAYFRRGLRICLSSEIINFRNRNLIEIKTSVHAENTIEMKQLTINISDNRFNTFLEFIKTLDYVEVPEADKKYLEELQHSLSQVKLMQDGKIQKQSANDFLNEL